MSLLTIALIVIYLIVIFFIFVICDYKLVFTELEASLFFLFTIPTALIFTLWVIN